MDGGGDATARGAAHVTGADADDDGGDGAGDGVESSSPSGKTTGPGETTVSGEVDLAGAVGDGPVLLFDGVCNLCTGAVQFVVERDRHERIRFASLQSELGSVVRERLDLPPDELDTVVLVEDGGAYTRSAAVIRVCELLGGRYRLATLGWLLPRHIRDRLYDIVAEHRYGWFGRTDQCMVPTPELRSRFVD
jgi:predicted DCC family thiol-disulfide oxidoreductase YuxK